MKFWRWCWMVGALLVGVPAHAESWPPDSVRYVRADADGGNGGRANTADSAWTLAEACAQATAGYTVLIAPGDYTSVSLTPLNYGVNRDSNPPWPGSHGRVRFVGNTFNAQACSVSSISLNVPYVTIMGVSTKIGGSLSLGSNSGVGSSKASFDSLYRVYLKRTQTAFSMYGVQNSVVAQCSLMNYPTSSAGRAFTMSVDDGTEIECARTSGTRVCQFDTLAVNFFLAEQVRSGERRFLVADHTNNCFFAGNTFVGYGNSTAVSGDTESLIFFEIHRSNTNLFWRNRYIFDSDYDYDDMRALALRDSAYFNTFHGDTVYAGLDYNSRGGAFANKYKINWTLGQTGQPCPSGSYAGSFGNVIGGGRYILSGSFGVSENNQVGFTRVDSCVIVSTNSNALHVGDVATSCRFTNNTVVAFNGGRAVFRDGDAHVGMFIRNIFVSDSLGSTAASSTCVHDYAGGGGVAFFNNPSPGAVNRNLYWARRGQFADGSHRGAVRDSAIKWTWRGYFAPDTTMTNGCHNGCCMWRTNNDQQSKFASPLFSDSSATKGFNAKPDAFRVAGISGTSGYVGAIAPRDTVSPSVPSLWTASVTAGTLAKEFDWSEPGDDSLFFSAESVFICERASVDSSRIDNTNFRSYILAGFAASDPGTLRSFTCDHSGTLALDGQTYTLPSDETAWGGCGSDAELPGGIIGFVRLVTKDDDGNLSFSATLRLEL